MNPMRMLAAITAGHAGTAVRAKAYCGPAHGQGWAIVGDGQTIPERVGLDAAGGVYSYQLVHDLRLGRVARDDHGNYLYMPVRPGR
ncbi:MAG: hypothetical protein ACXVGN_10730 [Mycobacteriaceae bacterium]